MVGNQRFIRPLSPKKSSPGLERAELRAKSAPQYRLLFQTAAVLGRLAALEARSKRNVAHELVRPEEVRRLVAALWSDGLARNIDFYRDGVTLPANWHWNWFKRLFILARRMQTH